MGDVETFSKVALSGDRINYNEKGSGNERDAFLQKPQYIQIDVNSKHGRKQNPGNIADFWQSASREFESYQSL